MLATLAVSLSVMRTRILPARKRALWDLPAFKEVPFTLFTLGMFFGFMGLYIPFFYVQSYAMEKKVCRNLLGQTVPPPEEFSGGLEM